MDPELLTALKALADPSRLRVCGAIASGRRMDAATLSSTLRIPRSTLTHHLRRLVDARLVTQRRSGETEWYELDPRRIGEIGRDLDALSRDAEPGAHRPDAGWPDATPEEARVLRAFIVDGRLQSIPVLERKRSVVLRHLAATVFEPDRDYPEKEVNQRLALLHPDVASLRRYLVDNGYMGRAASIYRLLPRAEWPVQEAADG